MITIYRISIFAEGEHKGYNYVGSYRECVDEIERLKGVWSDVPAEFDYTSFRVRNTKNGIIAALNRLAGHPE